MLVHCIVSFILVTVTNKRLDKSICEDDILTIIILQPTTLSDPELS